MIYSRYGCELKDLTWKEWPDGTISKEIVCATRIEDNKQTEYHITLLRADNGIGEIYDTLDEN